MEPGGSEVQSHSWLLSESEASLGYSTPCDRVRGVRSGRKGKRREKELALTGSHPSIALWFGICHLILSNSQAGDTKWMLLDPRIGQARDPLANAYTALEPLG